MGGLAWDQMSLRHQCTYTHCSAENPVVSINIIFTYKIEVLLPKTCFVSLGTVPSDNNEQTFSTCHHFPLGIWNEEIFKFSAFNYTLRGKIIIKLHVTVPGLHILWHNALFLSFSYYKAERLSGTGNMQTPQELCR